VVWNMTQLCDGSGIVDHGRGDHDHDRQTNKVTTMTTTIGRKGDGGIIDGAPLASGGRQWWQWLSLLSNTVGMA
jgi:hypothetical protein